MMDKKIIANQGKTLFLDSHTAFSYTIVGDTLYIPDCHWTITEHDIHAALLYRQVNSSKKTDETYSYIYAILNQ